MKDNKNTDSTIVGSMNHIYFIGWKIDESVMNVFKQYKIAQLNLVN
jgi:hypothetical protein